VTTKELHHMLKNWLENNIEIKVRGRDDMNVSGAENNQESVC
jgi:hypothetical protein